MEIKNSAKQGKARSAEAKRSRATFIAVASAAAVLLAVLVFWLVGELKGEDPSHPVINTSETKGNDEVEALVSRYIEELMKGKAVTIKAAGRSEVISALEAGAPVDFAALEAHIEQAGGNPADVGVYRTILAAKNMPESAFDDEYIAGKLESLSKKLDPGTGTTYEMDEEKVIFTRGEDGTTFDAESALLAVKKSFNEFKYAELEFETEKKPPEEPDWDMFYEEVFIEPQDAYYETGEDANTHIVPEVVGRSVDFDGVKDAVSSEGWTELEFDLVFTAPEVTVESLGGNYFLDVLGTYSTNYNENDVNRTVNVKLSAKNMDGVVVMPGKTFSFNRVVGERTVANGFKNATVYTSDGMVPGLGGGICQVSSTLYVATLYSELHVVSRYNHGYTVAYVPLGLDATVAWPYLDFVFKNDTGNPVRVDTICKNGKLTITIMGTREKPKREIKFVTNTLESYEPPIMETLDETMPAGYRQVKNRGSYGYLTETFKIVLENGVEVSRTRLSRDRYNPYRSEVIVGPEQATTEPPATTTTEPPVTTSEPPVTTSEPPVTDPPPETTSETDPPPDIEP